MRRLVKSMFLVSVWFGVLGLTYAQDIDSGVSFSQVIAALEATGQYPRLDRTDTFTDADHNGVRDDIDEYIYNLAVTDEQMSNLRQLAAAIQRTLAVNVNDAAALEAVKDSWLLGLDCVDKAFENPQHARKLGSKIKAYTANTKKRAFAAIRFSEALNGHVLSVTDYPVCDGDVYRENNARTDTNDNPVMTHKKPIAQEHVPTSGIVKIIPCPPVKLSEVQHPGNLANFCKPTVIRK